MRSWQNLFIVVPGLLMSACACPSPTGLGKNFIYLQTPPAIITNMAAVEPNRNLFPYRSASLPYHFDDVWTAVKKALKTQHEPITLENEGKGVICTDTAWHGLLGEYSSKYYINIDEAEPGKTTISYEYFRYDIWFPYPNNPYRAEIRPVTDQTNPGLMQCRYQLFEKEIVDSLPPP